MSEIQQPTKQLKDKDQATLFVHLFCKIKENDNQKSKVCRKKKKVMISSKSYHLLKLELQAEVMKPPK